MTFVIKHFAKLSRINFDKPTTTIGQIYCLSISTFVDRK